MKTIIIIQNEISDFCMRYLAFVIIDPVWSTNSRVDSTPTWPGHGVIAMKYPDHGKKNRPQLEKEEFLKRER